MSDMTYMRGSSSEVESRAEMEKGIPKTALVTGSGKRLGRAIVEDLARHGFAVAIHVNRSAGRAHPATLIFLSLRPARKRGSAMEPAKEQSRNGRAASAGSAEAKIESATAVLEPAAAAFAGKILPAAQGTAMLQLEILSEGGVWEVGPRNKVRQRTPAS